MANGALLITEGLANFNMLLQIGYTAAFSLGMLSPGDTFGLTWTPRQQPQAPRLERHEVWGACGWYTARPAGEWLADVGYKFKASHGGANLRC
jgi:hypothetical protein